VLASYSMITLTSEAVSLHRLVQAVILARQPPQDDASAFGGEPPLTTALDWLAEALPADPRANVAPLVLAWVHGQCSGANRAVKCRSCRGWDAMRMPGSWAARSATRVTTSIT